MGIRGANSEILLAFTTIRQLYVQPFRNAKGEMQRIYQETAMRRKRTQKAGAPSIRLKISNFIPKILGAKRARFVDREHSG